MPTRGATCHETLSAKPTIVLAASAVADSKFSAVDAALGYAYQTRCALLHSLRYARSGEEFQVGLETLDDVTFTIDGNAHELLQTKHHLGSKSSLTDAAVDLWKTIRVWVDAWSSGAIDSTAKLFLLTTATASAGTAPAYLRADPRDVMAAVDALTATASSSSNQENKAAYEAYLSLTPAERTALISQAYVLDASPNLTDLDTELQREVRWSVRKEDVGAFLERLEGWWFRRVLQQLTKTGPLIESGEIESQMSDLREQFQREALPIDSDILEMELNQSLLASCAGKMFVYQIELVTTNARRIGFAIRDYFRAYEQRSRWIRRDLVLDMELHKYEKRLVEEWEMAYERIRDEIGTGATDDVMKKAGLGLLSWAENALLPIRKNVTESFISRGSFHLLADATRVGWHPNFRERLAAVLKAQEPTL